MYDTETDYQVAQLHVS